jgi:large subunit ribosomal protein L6
MSRLIKKPITIPSGVTITANDGVLSVKGPKGENKILIPKDVVIKTEGQNFWVSAAPAARSLAIQGTFWSLTRNAIEGVTDGFIKILEIVGVGYRAVLEGKELVLFLGYALPVRMPIPETVTIAVEASNDKASGINSVIKVSGINKDDVGRAAAEIRALKKPEPYKGKGIHYQGEVIRRKLGKRAGASATAA